MDNPTQSPGGDNPAGPPIPAGFRLVRVRSNSRKKSQRPHRRRGRKLTRAEVKLLKFRKAKTLLGRANYFIDFCDELRPDPARDEVLHLFAELSLGQGPPVRRIERWSRKFMKYRLANAR